uniref:Uncharacterized protein n=1 Tax=Timema bartmani TaxID=61472 RepID=A0A7R9ER17_9NEOP|nr:unnamed protein product [Timema bartmani]
MLEETTVSMTVLKVSPHPSNNNNNNIKNNRNSSSVNLELSPQMKMDTLDSSDDIGHSGVSLKSTVTSSQNPQNNFLSNSHPHQSDGLSARFALGPGGTAGMIAPVRPTPFSALAAAAAAYSASLQHHHHHPQQMGTANSWAASALVGHYPRAMFGGAVPSMGHGGAFGTGLGGSPGCRMNQNKGGEPFGIEITYVTALSS